MSYEIHAIFPIKGHGKFTSPIHTIGIVWEYIWTYCSLLTGIPHAWLYYVAGSALGAAALVTAYLFLLSKFSRNVPAIILGTLTVLVILPLLREGGVGLGNPVLSRIWMGKIILQLAWVPIAVACMMDFLRFRNLKSWLQLFSAMVCAVGLSSSGIFLAPMLCLILGCVSLVAYDLFHNHEIVERFKAAVYLMLSTLFPVLLALALYWEARNTLQQNLGIYGNESVDVLAQAYSWFFVSWTSNTSLLVYACFIALIFVERSTAKFIFAWMGLVILFFINPVVEPYVAKFVTSRLAYNRVFSLLPIPALFGVTVSLTLEKFWRFRQIFVPAQILAVSAVLCAVVLDPKYHNVYLDQSRASFLGNERVLWPGVKIDPQLLDEVQDIISRVPQGPMASSSKYGLIIPMITSKIPQTYTWLPQNLIILGQGNELLEPARERLLAYYFLNGAPDKTGELAFRKLLDGELSSVVIDPTTPNIANIQNVVTDHGFHLVPTDSSFLLYLRM
ncbi:MAG TPA: hypothetical protein VE954_18350 [Oligoflexus sp.]|uniref:hypothetical protein n=1 Tax=Oligoflexus sp. TaxID=1971216 RepID=UPI002D246EE6|nr:hypothetical protein [Oligoflexus sp.]HYX35063.1 hypothetical protein [Oligoflexus sp.]